MIFEENDDGSLTFDDAFYTRYPHILDDINISFTAVQDTKLGRVRRTNVKGTLTRRDKKPAEIWIITSYDDARLAYTAERRPEPIPVRKKARAT